MRRGGHMNAWFPCPYALCFSDGPPDFDLDNLKPFHERSEREKEELYEKIAEQLAAIADQYNLESPHSCMHSPKSSNSPSSHSGPCSEPDIDKLGAAAIKPRGKSACNLAAIMDGIAMRRVPSDLTLTFTCRSPSH
jgi:hypothetical protein